MNYLQQQFENAQKTLDWLGIDNPFKLDDIHLTDGEVKTLKKHNAIMIITPKIDDTFTNKDLVDKYDKSFGKESYTYRTFEYDDKQPARVSFVYMDQGLNKYNGDGLFGTNLNYDDQNKLLKTMKNCRAVGVVDYIVLQATMKVLKKNPIDKATWTHFIGDPHAFIRGGNWLYGSSGGVLALYLNNAPSSSNTNIGFRVSRDILTLDSSSLVASDTTLDTIAQKLKDIIAEEKEAEYKRGFEDGKKSILDKIKELK